MSPRPLRATDVDAVGSLVSAAFGEEGATIADLVEALRAEGHVRAEIVATRGADDDAEDGAAEEDLVGHVVLTRAWLDDREALVDVLVLSPLAVAPDRQRAGVGTRLVAAAVEEAARLGAPALFLEGSPDYYGARGFGPGAQHGFESPSHRIPDAAFQVAVLPAHERWMRGRLVYPSTFWARDCVGLRDPLLAELETLTDDG